jgi:hypothetical protein
MIYRVLLRLNLAWYEMRMGRCYNAELSRRIDRVRLKLEERI